MSEQTASYRRMLKSSSIIGGASLLNILIGLARTKVLALLLGPSGVGLASLFSSAMGTASAIATLGLDTVGTRQIAEAAAREDGRALAVARRAMFLQALFFAAAGALAFWSLRQTVARQLLGSAEQAPLVGWLSLGVALSVAVAAQGALIQGMRRIGDMARLSVLGSALNTLCGLALLWHWGQAGLVAYVLIAPLSSFLLGQWFVARLPKVQGGGVSLPELKEQWRTLLRLGVPFMGAGLVGMLVQLWIRVELGDTLGTAALGQFQASWTVSMQYVGLVLGAMGADYYPRLTGVIQDREAATRLVNEQSEIALLLSAPLFIALIGLTPWVIRLLYSEAFLPAVELLRWQILGDVLKVAGWPLGFVTLAAGAGRTFFWLESGVILFLGCLIAAFSAKVGLQITGMAFLACYALYLPVVYRLAARRIGFSWRPQVTRLLTVILSLCVLVALLSARYWWGGVVTVGLTLAFGLYSLTRLALMSEVGGTVGRVAAWGERLARMLGGPGNTRKG